MIRMDEDAARNSAPERDEARHSLTIKQASQLFAELGVPRAPRSVQRFCEHGYLDCVRIKGAKGDQFFINRASVELYAEELRQIEAVALIGAEARHDAPERVAARNSAPEYATTVEVETEPISRPEPEQPEASALEERLRDEILNLRIDNRAKEIAIAELNRRLNEDRDKFLGAMQDMSYKLGAMETLLAQIEAPKALDDEARQSATDPATASAGGAPMLQPGPSRRSFLGRLFG